MKHVPWLLCVVILLTTGCNNSGLELLAALGPSLGSGGGGGGGGVWGCHDCASPSPAPRPDPPPVEGQCTQQWCVAKVAPTLPGHPWVSEGEGLSSIWSSSAHDVWIANAAGLDLHGDGTHWANASESRDFSFSGTAADDVWSVSPEANAGIRHWDGHAWSASPGASPTAGHHAIWVSTRTDAWAASDSGLLEHWDGAIWSEVAREQPSVISSFWGNAPDDVWGLSEGAFSHWDGATWSNPIGPSQDAEALWGSSRNDVWAVGRFGLVAHWDGARWSEWDSQTDVWLHGVWGSGPDDVWAVGDLGVVIHWDGSSWQRSESGVELGLVAVSGSGPNDVWVAGSNVVLHHAGP